MNQYTKTVEKWNVFEIRTQGRTDGNPFADYEVWATFTGSNEQKTVRGFYDGDGEYVVRFMPSYEGTYTFEISGSYADKKLAGEFLVTAPTGNNHGPVHVENTYHLKYADGSSYYSLGTTCYAWVHQTNEMQEQTLQTLDENAFNKIRFCMFPKHYDYNYEDPITFPYVGTPCDNSRLNRSTMFEYMEDKSSNHWDFKVFNPEHFKRFDKRIEQLMERNIQADLILFHPYDRWGFDGMGAEYDDFYVSYVVARYGAYRNIWWSLANEYDYVKTKTIEDWDRIGELIHKEDPYKRMCSVHNGPAFYDFSREWITHCSCQGTDRYKATELTAEIRQKYGKPVVWDEILYEGNIDLGWGNIGPEEMTRRFWEATMRGGYAGHGETYLFAADETMDYAKLWWSHGGVLYGESPKRIAFLYDILKDIPGGQGLRFLPQYWDAVAATTEDESKEFYLFYFTYLRPLYRDMYFDDTTEYEVDVIDTWNMEIVPRGTFKGKFRILVGGKPYMAIRVRKRRINK
ncbi:MAG: DUF5060 domain-containing protein [Lachnospiraceae bacterium]|nr:DUF5060 domain-containing protein [Lachnospiraceae bacterium]